MLRYVFRDCSITSLTVKLSYYNLITSTKFERDPYFWISTGLLNAFNASLRLLINFTSTWFLMFSMVFPKTAVFINLKNSFSDSFLVFVYSFVLSLMCFFNQGSFLKLILLWIFLILEPRLRYCFSVLWLSMYFSSSFRFLISFSTLLVINLSGASGKLLCKSWSSFGYLRFTSRMQEISL